MMRPQVLVVDDEPDLLELAHYNLTQTGYDVACVASGEEALAHVRSHQPDLVILDLLLPGVDGWEVCKILKRDPRTATIPIMMLTARSEEADMVTGLELGADDYLTKPFSPRVLLARVKAALRRRQSEQAAEQSAISRGDLVIYPGYYTVRVQENPVRLTPTEFRILHLLAQRPGWVFSRYQIVDNVRGTDVSVTERSVDVHIAALRRKLGDSSEVIETVRGVGYRFKT
jgi:two-component system phosphate regulon response regulator PhoB